MEILERVISQNAIIKTVYYKVLQILKDRSDVTFLQGGHVEKNKLSLENNENNSTVQIVFNLDTGSAHQLIHSEAVSQSQAAAEPRFRHRVAPKHCLNAQHSAVEIVALQQLDWTLRNGQNVYKK